MLVILLIFCWLLISTLGRAMRYPTTSFSDTLAYPSSSRPSSGIPPSMLGATRSTTTNIFTNLVRNSTTRFFPSLNSYGLSSTSSPSRSLTMTTAAAATGGSVAQQQPSSPNNNTATALSSLEDLPWNNVFTEQLPGDPSTENRIRQVQNSFYSFVSPTPTGTEPSTIIYAPDVAQLIGLDPSECERPEFPLCFSGNAPLPGTKPYAQCYGGHQFGHWAGQLGDGRAISLGEVSVSSAIDSETTTAVDTDSDTTSIRWELQLKGAGPTPYSRRADGRAVLRSSIREFIASEAMFALGVPTTRALSLVGTGDQVVRDMFYSGNPQLEPGAVVCRVARTFIRFGTFQLPASREEQEHMVQQLADYVVEMFYPHILSKSTSDGGSGGGGDNNKYVVFLKEVAKRTAVLVSEWHRVGFVHGVLNTDNMSIVGDTIDYGPYGFLERFDPEFTPNTTDLPGRRYCFKAQPEIGQFNMIQLALAMVKAGLMTQEDAAEAIEVYAKTFNATYEATIAKKFGLTTYNKDLSIACMQLMLEDSADYTNTFRALSAVDTSTTSENDTIDSFPEALSTAITGDANTPLSKDRVAAWSQWLSQYKAVLRAQNLDDSERKKLQNSVNPVIIPRNHVLVEIIGSAEQGDYEPLNRYYNALKTPYVDHGEIDEGWKVPGPKESRLGVELLSCSS